MIVAGLGLGLMVPNVVSLAGLIALLAGIELPRPLSTAVMVIAALALSPSPPAPTTQARAPKWARLS